MAELSGGYVHDDGTEVTSFGHVREVTHTSRGHYNISFDTRQTAFVVTQVSGWDGNTRDNALIIHVNAARTMFTVKTGDADGEEKDRGFSYISF